ncbi:hypothetical protein [Kocuria sp. CH-021]|uniref:hypothetical protein n=1 Tax=Kocuria sp. CH-021 TaxID=3406735 RepID=UPI003C706FE5
MKELRSPLAILAAVGLIVSVCGILFLLLVIIHQANPLPWVPADALSWDGFTAIISTLLSAGIAGGVAALVLNVQNKHQVRIQDKTFNEQREQARMQREVQSAADLAKEIDQRWHLYDDVFDLEKKFGDLYLPAVQIRDLRRLTNLWTAQLNGDLLQKAGITRADLGNAVQKYVRGIDWAIAHYGYAEGRSSSINSEGPVTPGRVMDKAHTALAKFAHYITSLPVAPDDTACRWLRQFVRNGQDLGTFLFDQPEKRQPNNVP